MDMDFTYEVATILTRAEQMTSASNHLVVDVCFLMLGIIKAQPNDATIALERAGYKLADIAETIKSHIAIREPHPRPLIRYGEDTEVAFQKAAELSQQWKQQKICAGSLLVGILSVNGSVGRRIFDKLALHALTIRHILRPEEKPRFDLKIEKIHH